MSVNNHFYFCAKIFSVIFLLEWFGLG